MSVFQHPHLTRGIVKTAKGAFVVSRGLVEMPDEIGESLGWRPVDRDNDMPADVSRSHSPESMYPTAVTRSSPLMTAADKTRERPIVEGPMRRSYGLKQPAE